MVSFDSLEHLVYSSAAHNPLRITSGIVLLGGGYDRIASLVSAHEACEVGIALCVTFVKGYISGIRTKTQY